MLKRSNYVSFQCVIKNCAFRNNCGCLLDIVAFIPVKEQILVRLRLIFIQFYNVVTKLMNDMYLVLVVYLVFVSNAFLYV